MPIQPHKTSPSPSKGGEQNSKPGFVTANSKTYALIKEMREHLKANPTKAENVLWELLRTKKTGYKIRRQHIIGDFIVDFVCLPLKLVIEVDGKIHEFQKEYDELRTYCLNELDYTVIRFTNEEIIANPQAIANKIKNKLNSINESPSFGGVGEV